MRRILVRPGFVASTVACLGFALTLAVTHAPGWAAVVRAEDRESVPVTPQTPEPVGGQPESADAVLAPGATPTRAGMEERRRVLLQPLPASATQADRGAQIYNLVCSACHGYTGEGLTDEWRATWAPEDQNCWQSKCHAPSHPPDGFEIPRYVPPAVGPSVTARFHTALDLYEYLRTTMPWHEPASLLDDQYWDITAYTLRLMGLDQGDGPLDRESAAELVLQPGEREAGVVAPTSSPTVGRLSATPTVPPTEPAQPGGAESPAAAGGLLPVWWLVLVLAVAGVAVGAILATRSRRRS